MGSDMLELIASHPGTAYLLILLISLLESLAIIGLIFPGTIIMLGVGMVISTGALSLKPAILMAIVGSILGDGISFWTGRIYHERLKGFWPFNRHPRILPAGEEFFHRHGGKSVLFGRFIGPMRPVIPIVAGMLRMGPLRFTLVDVTSGIIWAFAYTLPGFLFGTSLALAGNISSRLSILLLLVVAAIWAFVWLCHYLIVFMMNYGPRWFNALERWIVSDKPVPGVISLIKRLLSWFLLREKGEELLLLFLALVIFSAGWGFIGVMRSVVMKEQLMLADQAIYHFLHSLRNPWADHLFIGIIEIGTWPVNLAVGIIVLLALILSHCYRTARYWIISLAGGIGLYVLIKIMCNLTEPLAVSAGISPYGFPSGPIMIDIVLYGTIALLVAKGLRNNTIRWGLFVMVFLVSFAIAFAHLYIGAHPLSDILGGFLLASFWTALAGIVYLKDYAEPVPKRFLGSMTFIVLFLAGSWQITEHHARDFIGYAPRHEIQTMDLHTWLKTGWQRIPAWRTDLKGEREQPMTLQWVGSLDRLSRYLLSHGWSTPEEISTKAVLGMLSPETKVRDLPLFPHLHNGRVEGLVLSRGLGDKRMVLRIWPTDVRLQSTRDPFWVGMVEIQKERRVAGLVTITSGTGDYTAPTDLLLKELKETGLPCKVVHRRFNHNIRTFAPGLTWDCKVILAMDSPGPNETQNLIPSFSMTQLPLPLALVALNTGTHFSSVFTGQPARFRDHVTFGLTYMVLPMRASSPKEYLPKVAFTRCFHRKGLYLGSILRT